MGFFIVMVGLTACSHQDEGAPASGIDARTTPMTFRVSYPGVTRATASGFEENDSIGLFVGLADKPLETGGNFVNNEPLSLRNGTWRAAHTLYWDEGVYNAYAYYPYRRSITSVDAEPFSVSTRQDLPRTGSALGGYEASDLLFASATALQASQSPVPLQFRHVMSKLKIRLIKGEDYDGEMPKTAEVYVHNTVTKATVDLQAGIVTRDMKSGRQTIRAHQDDSYLYSAILVPQRLANRVPLLEVVMGGVSYLFESRFVFKPGVEHLVNIVINTNPEKASISIGGEIEGWN